MSLEKTYTLLKDNLYQPFILYIPEIIIPKNLISGFSKEFKTLFFNKVIVIEKNGNAFELNDKPNTIDLYSKESILESNLLILLDQKGKLAAFQFNILFDKYKMLLNTYCHIINSIAPHLVFNIKDENILTVFKLQQHNFNTHQKTIN
jgi:hypothetical protein